MALALNGQSRGVFTMLQKMSFILTLAFALAMGPVSAESKAPFPDLVDINGAPVTNQADLGNGKWQLVMIWATNCHVCAEMKPKLSVFHDKHKDGRAEVFGVALDGRANVDAVKRYMVDHKVTFPTYVGELDMIAANYQINSQSRLAGTPTYMLFNPAGELMAIDFGMLDIDAIERFMDRHS